MTSSMNLNHDQYRHLATLEMERLIAGKIRVRNLFSACGTKLDWRMLLDRYNSQLIDLKGETK